jgi:hypothetical protein
MFRLFMSRLALGASHCGASPTAVTRYPKTGREVLRHLGGAAFVRDMELRFV